MYSHIINVICIILDTYVQSIFFTTYVKQFICNGFLNTMIDPSGIHLINIEWQRNGQKINDTSHYTITKLSGSVLSFGQTLHYSIKTSLAGIYSCVAWIGNNKARNKTISTKLIVESKL